MRTTAEHIVSVVQTASEAKATLTVPDRVNMLVPPDFWRLVCALTHLPWVSGIHEIQRQGERSANCPRLDPGQVSLQGWDNAARWAMPA
jgi:hypothetical protein